ncbi:uracil-DNA glycosylase [bacterium]|nr:uracil-DNA glycosylase [bacterium]
MEQQIESYTTSKKENAIVSFNLRIKNCEKCRLSTSRTHVLMGEGNLDARFMLIALSPGEKEDAENRMFIGPSGNMLDKLLKASGMDRKSIYMTNLIKCMLPKNRRPKMDEIESCSPFLDEEIAIIHSEWIVPLGYYATRYVLTKYHTDPPPARTDFINIYGKPIIANNQKIVPLPHPASLLYNPSFESETMKKYKKLQIFSDDCKWFPLCPMKWYYEAGHLERKWIELYCRGDWESCVRYEMEEQGHDHPDWMLPDGSLDVGLKKM